VAKTLYHKLHLIEPQDERWKSPISPSGSTSPGILRPSTSEETHHWLHFKSASVSSGISLTGPRFGTEKQKIGYQCMYWRAREVTTNHKLSQPKTTQRNKSHNSLSIHLAQANSQTLHLIPIQRNEKPSAIVFLC